ncbi:hypothetical protein Acr_13g0004620 [Actinidia rufa]|uniref:Uncharacterized protein n=1 Tax=Actinidia rufa TaxID=165716 RepID=A0A7J0FK31_9ERIC|nr:hypothetical protein Acr_13g0004620 [Actinidia rufa]
MVLRGASDAAAAAMFRRGGGERDKRLHARTRLCGVQVYDESSLSTT